MSGDKKRREAKAKKEIGTWEKEAIVVLAICLWSALERVMRIYRKKPLVRRRV